MNVIFARKKKCIFIYKITDVSFDKTEYQVAFVRYDAIFERFRSMTPFGLFFTRLQQKQELRAHMALMTRREELRAREIIWYEL